MIKTIENNYKAGIMASVVMSVLGIFFSYLFKGSFIILSILGLALGIVSYASARINMSEDDVNLNFKLISLTMITSLFGFIHQIFYSSIYKSAMKLSEEGEFLSEMYANMANSAFFLSFIVNAGILVFLLLYLRDEERKEKIMALKDMSFKKIEAKKEEVSTENPDIVLCKDAETGQDVIWPHSDRYTHCLCLGPTGSGKTSQTIIPFIYQDIQKSNVGITVLEPKGVTKNKMLPALCK